MPTQLLMAEFASLFSEEKMLEYAKDLENSEVIPAPPKATYIFPRKMNPLIRDGHF